VGRHGVVAACGGASAWLNLRAHRRVALSGHGRGLSGAAQHLERCALGSPQTNRRCAGNTRSRPPAGDNRAHVAILRGPSRQPAAALLKQAAQILHAGGIAAVPTDSSYALVCHLDDKAAAEKPAAHPRRRRQAPPHAAVPRPVRAASYARVDNRQYRLLKLGRRGRSPSSSRRRKEVPRRVSHPSRRTIGLRVPDHRVTQDLLEVLGQPLLATTLIPPGETEPLNDPQEIRAASRRCSRPSSAPVHARPSRRR
jgi:tRNA threonylcarbamoyl adenosine modification protein (Sua5/YciO/YrdC/YwlC family)